MKNLSTALLTFAILALLVMGCSESKEKSSNTSTDNKNSASSSPSPTASKDADVAGNYSITGKNPAGQSYDGTLAIKKQDQVYQFSWSVAGSSYDGVGVRDGNLIAVGYGAGENGKGCGAAIYRRTGDKTMEGRLGGWGINKVGIQNLTLIKETGDGLIFSVNGSDTDGSEYRGELFVAQSKTDVYHFAFAENGKAKYIGTGIKVGDYFGAGMGVKQCGYVVYEVKGDRLEAAWGVIGNDVLGTEIATRK